MRSFALAAVCGWCLFPVALGDDSPTAATTQKFEMASYTFAGVVESVAANGSVRIVPFDAPRKPPANRRPLAEGYYLGIVFHKSGGGFQKLFKTQIEEVLDDYALELHIDADAAKMLLPGDYLALSRPPGTTTAQMHAVPDYAPFVNAEDAPSTAPASTPLAASSENLRKIGIAMHNFHDVHKRLPPAVIYGPDGKPWHSWRVLLLPYLGEGKLYEQYRFDEPWDGPNNSKLSDSMPNAYRDSAYGDQTKPYTNYAVVLGENTAFRAKGGRFDGNAQNLQKAFAAGRNFREFKDGLSNTVLVGPVRPDDRIPWLKPSDLSFEQMPGIGTKGGFAAPHRKEKGSAAAFLMADGSQQVIASNLDSPTLKQLFAINDSQDVRHIPSVPAVPPVRRVQRLHIVETDDGPVAKIVNEPVDP